MRREHCGQLRCRAVCPLLLRGAASERHGLEHRRVGVERCARDKRRAIRGSDRSFGERGDGIGQAPPAGAWSRVRAVRQLRTIRGELSQPSGTATLLVQGWAGRLVRRNSGVPVAIAVALLRAATLLLRGTLHKPKSSDGKERTNAIAYRIIIQNLTLFDNMQAYHIYDGAVLDPLVLYQYKI